MEPEEGFEPPTSSLQVRRSGQLSYSGNLVWIRGLLPDETLSLTFVRAYQDTIFKKPRPPFPSEDMLSVNLDPNPVSSGRSLVAPAAVRVFCG